MKIDESDYLAHYGILRKSGRYPWGSGNNQSQRNKSFLDYIDDLKKRLGMGETEIARTLEISTTELRAARSIAKNEQRQARISQAQALKDKGYSNVAIGQKMGEPESTIRTLLAPGAKDKADLLTATANMLKAEVAEKKYLDVGTGTENHIGVSETRLKTAVAILREEGYELHYIKVPQLGIPGNYTYQKVLCPPGTEYTEVSANRGEVKRVGSYSEDGGRTYSAPIHTPIVVNPKRVSVRYADEGGTEADGVIYVRPGVEDLSLGAASYAQVRVQVGDGHYLKGMAMYKDDLPDGVDLMFNTNKDDTGNKLDAMKGLQDDADLPFGAVVRQLTRDTGLPTERVTSAMNIVNEEGDWSDWSRNIAPQMLSKQKPSLIKEQLDVTYERRQKELDEINSLTNATVRKKLLQEFADGTDAASVHLKAAALPRQGSHVILPVQSLSEGEVYAPNFNNGERVVLIRYPHGGTFEIPELVVNNRHPESVGLLGQAKDAIGINAKVAERLSGADFDGDTVTVIPNNRGKITTSSALKELKGFDPRSSYPGYDGMKPMTNTQTEMGIVSNLITDMTIKGAPHSDIARAVKHSMVVIDAEKHGLNHKLSYQENGIKQLKEKYQSGGASTLISRAKGQVRVPDRKPRPAALGGPVDPKTGKLVFVETGRTRNDTGAPITKKFKRLEITEDATTLSSGTRVENMYAQHSNKLKGLANKARKAAVNTPRAEYSPSAKKAYEAQVTSLNAQLDLALRNRPLERQAQVIANATVRQKQDANPNMDSSQLKKVKQQALAQARAQTGAKKIQVKVSPAEWDAIQAGAISDSKLSTILQNADMDVVKKLATPRTAVLMSPSKTKRAATMLASGYTRSEVAGALGVSISTLDEATNG